MGIVPSIARNLLRRIKESEDQELVYETGGGWWVGLHRTSGAAATACLRLCLLSLDHSTERGNYVYQVWTLNSESEASIADPDYTPLIVTAIAREKP